MLLFLCFWSLIKKKICPVNVLKHFTCAFNWRKTAAFPVELCTLFYWSDLFFFKYAVLVTIGLWHFLKSSNMMSSFFLLKIVLVIWDLVINRNFRVKFCIFGQCHWYFDSDYIKYLGLWVYSILLRVSSSQTGTLLLLAILQFILLWLLWRGGSWELFSWTSLKL
jgi:hypothetical protein